MLKRLVPAFAGPGLFVLTTGVYAADACKHRGELDAMYCDDNDDMVADAPPGVVAVGQFTRLGAALCRHFRAGRASGDAGNCISLDRLRR
jgi:hypothetical protein